MALSGCAHIPAPQLFSGAGTMVDDQRRTVPNATVEIYRYTPENWFRPPEMELEASTQADNQGSFHFAATNRMVLVVARKVGSAPACRLLQNLALDGTAESLVLTQPTELSGIIIDPNGKPVAGAEV